MKLYFPEHKYTQELPCYLPVTGYLCPVQKHYILYGSKMPGKGEKCFHRQKNAASVCWLSEGQQEQHNKMPEIHGIKEITLETFNK